MTPKDAQIDLLMRSFSRKAERYGEGSDRGGAHLDVDELNAFAEGALPPAARVRYVSHLADCDHCRTLATQLAMTAGATAAPRVEGATGSSLWQRLKGMFAVPNLRYAAFALVVVAAVGITFVVLRQERENNLVARRTEVAPSQGPAASQAEKQGSAGVALENRQTSKPPATTDDSKIVKNKSSESIAAPPPLKETELAKSAPVVPSKRADTEVAEVAPSYAPPPPGERNEPAAPEAKDLKSGVAGQAASQPKKAEDEFGGLNRARAEEINRGREMDIDRARSKHGPNRNDNNAAKANVARNEEPPPATRAPRDKTAASQDQSRTQGLIAGSSGAAPEERKVAGRTFRRQGGAWVDNKFKSSMSVSLVRRGSEEFRALDSGLRSLAEQISGEVVVVWKGRAYRIR